MKRHHFLWATIFQCLIRPAWTDSDWPWHYTEIRELISASSPLADETKPKTTSVHHHDTSASNILLQEPDGQTCPRAPLRCRSPFFLFNKQSFITFQSNFHRVDINIILSLTMNVGSNILLQEPDGQTFVLCVAIAFGIHNLSFKMTLHPAGWLQASSHTATRLV
jgi:hypothetical protein